MNKEEILFKIEEEIAYEHVILEDKESTFKLLKECKSDKKFEKILNSYDKSFNTIYMEVYEK